MVIDEEEGGEKAAAWAEGGRWKRRGSRWYASSD